MIKIGILSDTHGAIHPGIVGLMNKCDIVIHAGDIINENSLKQINPKQKFIAVKGNNDIHIDTLNEVEVLELPGGNIVIEHGHKHGHFEPSHDSMRAGIPRGKDYYLWAYT